MKTRAISPRARPTTRQVVGWPVALEPPARSDPAGPRRSSWPRATTPDDSAPRRPSPRSAGRALPQTPRRLRDSRPSMPFRVRWGRPRSWRPGGMTIR